MLTKNNKNIFLVLVLVAIVIASMYFGGFKFTGAIYTTENSLSDNKFSYTCPPDARCVASLVCDSNNQKRVVAAINYGTYYELDTDDDYVADKCYKVDTLKTYETEQCRNIFTTQLGGYNWFANDNIALRLSNSQNACTKTPSIYLVRVSDSFCVNKIHFKESPVKKSCNVGAVYINNNEVSASEQIYYLKAGETFKHNAEFNWEVTEPYSVSNIKINNIVYKPALTADYTPGNDIIQVESGQKINIEFSLLNDDPVAVRNVYVYLDDNRKDSILTTNPLKLLSFNAPSTAKYYNMQIEVEHPDGNKIFYYTIQVLDPITVEVTTSNPVQYDSDNIQLKINTKINGLSKDIATGTLPELQASFNNIPVSNPTIKRESIGLYSVLYNIKGEGTLRVRARAYITKDIKTGLPFWSDWSTYKDITVKQSSIIIIPSLINNVNTGVYVSTFRTTNSVGAALDTRPSVTIIDTTGKETEVEVTKTGTGMYSFSYNFANGGLYTAKITANTLETGDVQLNNGDGEPITIISTGGTTPPPEDDTGNGVITGGTTPSSEPNYTLYIIVFLILIVLGIIVFFIFKKK